MEPQTEAVLTRTTQSAIHSGVRALSWACRYLSRLLLARATVAVVVIIASLTIAVYALWIGAILWLVTGRFGFIRPGRRRRQVEITVAAAAIAALIAFCANGQRSPLNLAVIASCSLAGAIVWFERRATLEALRAELHKSR